ncbi:hypothetical protein N7470_004467 [Penicillium chermesinum]|nr:hypothetical protein N7470_004467 [Penicillium chermesinum]
MSEVNRQGLDQVYSCEKSGRSDGPIANIVFVHGLRGHPRRTWEYTDPTGNHPSTNGPSLHEETSPSEKRSWIRRLKPSSRPKQANDANSPSHDTAAGKLGCEATFWPADELPKTVPQADIFTYGYNADVIEGIFQQNNKNSIFQHGNDLMVRLERSIGNDVS